MKNKCDSCGHDPQTDLHINYIFSNNLCFICNIFERYMRGDCPLCSEYDLNYDCPICDAILPDDTNVELCPLCDDRPAEGIKYIGQFPYDHKSTEEYTVSICRECADDKEYCNHCFQYHDEYYPHCRFA